MRKYLSFVCVFLFFVGLNCLVEAQNSVQIIVDDMSLGPDAALHGVPPNYSWASGEASGNCVVPAQNNQGEWFRAMTAWGQVYIPLSGSPAINTRCQIRNVVTKLYMKNGSWLEVQSGDPTGEAFVEDFAGNMSIDAGIRDESTNGGGISVVVGVGPWTGYNFHFWPNMSRATVNPDSINAVYTSCEARLIIDNPGGPIDLTACKNILQMGADWWLNQGIGWLPDWSANSGIGNGRSKFVTPDWQFFNFCSLPPGQIWLTPPIPVNSTIEDVLPLPSMALFPNPIHSSKLTVVPPHSSSGIWLNVYHVSGQPIIQNREVGDEAFILDTELFQNGIYVVQLRLDSFVITQLLFVIRPS
ncbi:MAG: T9SS type A sorting domain-containing protein [Bacteroidetes bacterium]|nr:T9SS type A sorting domain-containing protein [Bacteroidota bacterium]